MHTFTRIAPSHNGKYMSYFSGQADHRDEISISPAIAPLISELVLAADISDAVLSSLQ